MNFQPAAWATQPGRSEQSETWGGGEDGVSGGGGEDGVSGGGGEGEGRGSSAGAV